MQAKALARQRCRCDGLSPILPNPSPHALASTMRKFFLPLSTLPMPASRRPVIES